MPSEPAGSPPRGCVERTVAGRARARYREDQGDGQRDERFEGPRRGKPFPHLPAAAARGDTLGVRVVSDGDVAAAREAGGVDTEA